MANEQVSQAVFHSIVEWCMKSNGLVCPRYTSECEYD